MEHNFYTSESIRGVRQLQAIADITRSFLLVSTIWHFLSLDYVFGTLPFDVCGSDLTALQFRSVKKFLFD